LLDTSSYPTGAEVCDYLVNYLVHFKLEPYARLNTAVRQITFDDEHQKWAVGIEGEGESVEFFDKLVVAIGGINGIPTYPAIEGEDVFKGKIIHSRAFKRPGDFAGKRVMVVGFGNTAVDTATQLAGVAGKVYLAHRHGALVVRTTSCFRR
jgi:dimethylaniline monooxygenase (N-oxide forming)